MSNQDRIILSHMAKDIREVESQISAVKVLVAQEGFKTCYARKVGELMSKLEFLKGLYWSEQVMYDRESVGG